MIAFQVDNMNDHDLTQTHDDVYGASLTMPKRSLVVKKRCLSKLIPHVLLDRAKYYTLLRCVKCLFTIQGLGERRRREGCLLLLLMLPSL